MTLEIQSALKIHGNIGRVANSLRDERYLLNNHM